MVVTCWVPQCNHNNKREDCQFFRFPAGNTAFLRWKKLIRRDAKPGPGARVCSCHFRDGKKENGPEILPYTVGRIFEPHYLTPEKKTSRTSRKLKGQSPKASTSSATVVSGLFNEESVAEEVIAEDEPAVQEPGPALAVASTSKAGPLPASVVALEAEIYLLKREVEKKDEIIKTLKLHFSYENICGNDNLVLLYTGLPTAAIFESLCRLLEDIDVQYYLKWKVQRISKVDQLLLTLMKLRQNFTHLVLATRFQVSSSTVTNIIITYVDLLERVLCDKLMGKIPSRQKNKSCLPNCFSTFTNCRIIIDCTEIFTAVPRESMKKQRLMYSSYKHRNTWKGLVGCAPNGVITFVSGLYAGSSSDKSIVRACGLLSHLEAGDLIIADKGFLIQDLLPAGVTLNIPPFLETAQFSPEQIRRTECIARVRIHVERAIRRIKCFKIVNFIPENLFTYSSKIFRAVAALTNLQYPLVKEVQQYYDDV